jgi:hypothetical protein
VEVETGEIALAELLALRTLFLNLQFRADRRPLTEAEMPSFIERADGAKMQRARERLEAVAEWGGFWKRLMAKKSGKSL